MPLHDMNIANADGATVRADINSALVAASGNFSGSTDPAGTYSAAYLLWADTGNDLMKIRNAANSAWIVLFKLSTGGFEQGADIISASALPVLADGVFNDVTGATGITSINTLGVGSIKWLQFDTVLTITHHATNLILPQGDITTTAGDVLCFYEYATGDWRLISNSAIPLPFKKGGDIATNSAGNLTPGTDGNAFDVTGTDTVTSIDAVKVGTAILLQFDGVVTVTHHSTNLILPSGSNITTVAGQILTFHEYATGDWRLVSNSEGAGGGITLGTEQASTSGTAIDFTSIPSGTKKITIMLKGVSTDGTEELLIQIGDSGGIETSGYLSAAQQSATGLNSTAGFVLITGAGAGNICHGTVTLTLEEETNFTWVSSGNVGRSEAAVAYVSGGSKSLSAELDRVRITTTGTPDTFDAGAINIQYE